jgi:hypothetical protein
MFFLVYEFREVSLNKALFSSINMEGAKVFGVQLVVESAFRRFYCRWPLEVDKTALFRYLGTN